MTSPAADLPTFWSGAMQLMLRAAKGLQVAVAPGNTLEEQLFEVHVARTAAESKCTRLESRLQELFGAALLSERQREALARRKGPTAAKAREDELIATIESLQRALEKQQLEAQQSVPSSRHMQERHSVPAQQMHVASSWLSSCLRCIQKLVKRGRHESR